MTAVRSNGDAPRGKLLGLSPLHLVTLSLLILSGCDSHLPLQPLPKPEPVETIEDFGKLYTLYCAGCHGPDGKLGPAPPLNDSIFLAIVPDDELKRVVAEGRKGTLMPAWSSEHGGPLTAKQVEVLAQGMKEQKDWAGPRKADADIPPYKQPANQPAGDKEAGAMVFEAACASCHGDQGRGGEKKNGKQIGAVRDPAFLALLSDQALRRYIITGRPDLGMPGYGPAAGRKADFKPLTSEDVSNLVALLTYWRQGGSVGRK